MYDFDPHDRPMLSAYNSAKANGTHLIPCPPNVAKGLQTKFYSLGHKLKKAREQGHTEVEQYVRLVKEVSLVVQRTEPTGLLLRRKDLDPMNQLVVQSLGAGTPQLVLPTIEQAAAESANRIAAMLDAEEAQVVAGESVLDEAMIRRVTAKYGF